MGISLMLKGISFQGVKAEFENPLLAFSRSFVHFWEWNTAPHLVLASCYCIPQCHMSCDLYVILILGELCHCMMSSYRSVTRSAWL